MRAMNRTGSCVRFAALAVVLAAVLGSLARAGGSIAWDHVYEDALARAAKEHKPLFIAVNMDGEVANDRAAQKLYRDARVVAVSGYAVNVVASRFDHAAEGKPCARFEGLTCKEHRTVDGSVRELVLKPDDNGYVIAPQHVFLAPNGDVLLSVPYEITAQELEWCFLTALNSVAPEHKRPIPPSVRPPRRLVTGGVFDPSTIEGANLAPPSRERALELIKELKASMFGEGRIQKLQLLLLSGEPEAVEYIEAELKIDWFGRRGWMREDPTNPGQVGDRQSLLLHAIGVLSPPVYWKVVAEYLVHDDLELRREAAVALEQLAAPESTRALSTAFGKEKNGRVRKEIARALGSAGAGDDKAIKTLAKAVASDKDGHVRVNALIALGWSSPNAEADRELKTRFETGTAEDRAASAIAMALSRNAEWVAVLERAPAADADLKPTVDAALTVLRGGSIGALRNALKLVAGDDLERERLFGRAQ